MREHRVHQLLFRGLQVHGDDVALDQLGDLGADHVGAEQLPGLLVEHHLHQALVLAERDGLAVADEREAADADVEALLLGLRLGETDRGDLRVAVGAARDLVLVERLGVKTDRGTIVIDGLCRTNVPGIYAIGDVAGPPMLAHKAEHEGVICIEAIKGLKPHPLDKRLIPGCTYCAPQIASVGLTEAKAKELKRDIRVGRFPFVGNGKAIALGEDQGLIKVIFDKKTGALIGAHMVGAEVTELIQGYVIAMNLETTEEELMHTIFPHPTLSEMMKEAVLDAYGRVLNM